MTVNKKIKLFLLFFALIFGAQSMQANILESFTKPMLENKLIALLGVSTLALGYTTYCFWKINTKLNNELMKKNLELNTCNLTIQKITREFITFKNEALTLFNETIKNEKLQRLVRCAINLTNTSGLNFNNSADEPDEADEIEIRYERPEDINFHMGHITQLNK